MKTRTNITLTVLAGLATAFSTGCGSAADADQSAAAASEIKGDVRFATAKLGVDGYGIVGQPAGDPACADLFVGSNDPYCEPPFVDDPVTLGYATHLYSLNNRTTPANDDGFASLAGKIIAVRVTPKIEGLADHEASGPDDVAQHLEVRAHRIVAEGFTKAEVGDRPTACSAFKSYFVENAASGRWLPRIEKIATEKLGGTELQTGDNIGDDSLLMTSICDLTVLVYQQAAFLTWDAKLGAYVGAFDHDLGKDGQPLAPYSHGGYQVDFRLDASVAMPVKANVHDAPTAFDVELFHRPAGKTPAAPLGGGSPAEAQ